VPSAMRILRDHYEDTFLEGPYFSAALPDFLTLCMHSHPAGFTWGNTASSSVSVLPEAGEGLPHMWWTALTPCTGLYIPVFVDALTVPTPLTIAGSVGEPLARSGNRPRPEHVSQDSYAEDSYWWRMYRLLETIKGGELGWDFEERRAIAREVFDPLEARWVAELPDVEKRAMALRDRGEAAQAAHELATFTEECVRQAVEAVGTLLERFE